jgi:hypothetical protein
MGSYSISHPFFLSAEFSCSKIHSSDSTLQTLFVSSQGNELFKPRLDKFHRLLLFVFVRGLESVVSFFTFGIASLFSRGTSLLVDNKEGGLACEDSTL